MTLRKVSNLCVGDYFRLSGVEGLLQVENINTYVGNLEPGWFFRIRFNRDSYMLLDEISLRGDDMVELHKIPTYTKIERKLWK